MKELLLISLLFFPLLGISQQKPVTTGVTTEEETDNKKSLEKDSPSLRDRIFFGGSFGASFGDYTYFNIAPVVGYKVSPTFSVGGGIIYQYSKDKLYDYSANNYGGRAFGIAKVFNPVFVQLEYEYLIYRYNNPYGETYDGNYSSLLGGGGIAQPLSKNVFFIATALYNFTYQNITDNSYRPYNSPWVFRVGINAGF